MAENEVERIRRYIEYAKTYSHRPSAMLIFLMLGDWGVVYGLFVLVTGIVLVALVEAGSADAALLVFIALQLILVWLLCLIWKSWRLRRIGAIETLRFDPKNPKPGQICEAIASPSEDFRLALGEVAASGWTPDPVRTFFRVMAVDDDKTANLQIIRTTSDQVVGRTLTNVRAKDLRSIER